MTSYSLAGKVTIITGAVGNLGVATARAFHQAGAKMVLVDRSQDRIREAFKDMAGSEYHLLAGGIDLSNLESLSKLVEQTLARFGRVDVLVNTVGGYRGGKPVTNEMIQELLKPRFCPKTGLWDI